MFNKDIFKKKSNILELKSYDLSDQVIFMQKKYDKVSRLLKSVLWTTVISTFILSSIIFTSNSLALQIVTGLIVGVPLGTILSFFTMNIAEKYIEKIEPFKILNMKEDAIRKDITNLSQQEEFQFQILTYFHNLLHNLGAFTFKNEHHEEERQMYFDRLSNIKEDLISGFSQHDFDSTTLIIVSRNTHQNIEEAFKILEEKNQHEYIINSKNDEQTQINQYKKKFYDSLNNEDKQAIEEKEDEYKHYL